MKRQERMALAEHTLQILDAGSFTNAEGHTIDVHEPLLFSVGNTKLFTPEELSAIASNIPNPGFETSFEVVNETTLNVARKLISENVVDPLILNFASAYSPGGGFLGGSMAQEECIARATGLYPSLLAAPEYYDYHRNNNTMLFSDHMIYSPKVPVIKDEEGNLLDKIVCTSVVTSAAVNAGAISNNEKGSLDKIIPVMETRIDKLLALCLYNKHEVLVLGAWGCGVFRNSPEDIARLFEEALNGKYKGQFRKVVFAVKTTDESVIEPFIKRFGSTF